MKHIIQILVSLLVLSLTACEDQDTRTIPSHVAAWLNEQDGQVLTFRNPEGRVRTVTVARTRIIGREKSGGKTPSYFHSDRIKVAYRSGPDSLLNL